MKKTYGIFAFDKCELFFPVSETTLMGSDPKESGNHPGTDRRNRNKNISESSEDRTSRVLEFCRRVTIDQQLCLVEDCRLGVSFTEASAVVRSRST